MSSRWHLLPNIRSRSPNTSAHCSRCWSCQEKHDALKHGMKQYFTHVTMAQSKITFSSWHQSPMAGRSLLAADAGPLACTYPSCATKQRTMPLTPREDIVVGLSRCHFTHILKQNIQYTLSLKQGKIPTQGDKPSMGCEDSFPC